ncbi:MAG: DUF2752 domain-containing protein [Prevotellaceae bacterium]|nr:DUF2752 domain-containing protein [Prevotellaceae bacterium]
MASNLLKSKELSKRIKGISILLIPIILYFIPVSWLNEQHSICIFKNIFGHECYGCGMTRAVVSAIQFDFDVACHYNMLVIIVLPLLIYIWIKTLMKLFCN